MKNNYMHYAGFSYSKSLTNFEAFGWNISSSINLKFLESAKLCSMHYTIMWVKMSLKDWWAKSHSKDKSAYTD